MATVDKVDDYLSSFKVSTSTKRAYRGLLMGFARYIDKRPRIEPSELVGPYLKERKSINPSLKESTMACYDKTIQAFCRWISEPATSERFDFAEAIESGTYCFIPGPRVSERDLRLFFRKRAMQSGRAAARDGAMLLLALTCGMAPNEIAAAKCEDLLINEDGMWLDVPQLGEGPILLPGIAANAVGECLLAKDGLSEKEPLVAETVTGKHSAMKTSEVRKIIDKSLDRMGYSPGKVFHGDSQITVAGMMKKLSLADQRKVAAYATRLYYSHVEL